MHHNGSKLHSKASKRLLLKVSPHRSFGSCQWHAKRQKTIFDNEPAVMSANMQKLALRGGLPESPSVNSKLLKIDHSFESVWPQDEFRTYSVYCIVCT